MSEGRPCGVTAHPVCMSIFFSYFCGTPEESVFEGRTQNLTIVCGVFSQINNTNIEVLHLGRNRRY